MEKMVLSWKYWACLALTGAAVIKALNQLDENERKEMANRTD